MRIMCKICCICKESKDLSSFSKKKDNRDGLVEACNFTNLQPLWSYDNLVKSNKIIGDN